MSDTFKPGLEVPLTFVMPMREDEPAFADFDLVRERVVTVMGEEYPPHLVTRICTMLAGNGIQNIFQISLNYATQDNGRSGSVRGVTFWGSEDKPLTLQRLMKQKGIGPHTGGLLLDFALNLQEIGPQSTSKD